MLEKSFFVSSFTTDRRSSDEVNGKSAARSKRMIFPRSEPENLISLRQR
jgi:hypothetical protein